MTGLRKTRHRAAGAALILALALALVTGVVGCASNTLRVGEGQSGGTVTLKPGQELVVELGSNPSTGYSWSLGPAPESAVLTAEGNEYKASSQKVVGAPGTEVWRFKAQNAGKTAFTLSYSRPWESVPPEKQFTLSVEVK